MHRIVSLGLIALLAATGPFAFAVSDDFTISTGITGIDVTSPSIPGSLTATPVALTQIDLAWSSSTDNVLVSGYQVFRDGAQIATSTAITYSDVGLTPSTTYTYYVTAFDSSGNVSASSTEVSTTTLASSSPPVATSTPSTTGGSAPKIESQIPPIELLRLEIVPDMTSAVIRYETRGFVRSIIKWGETTSYELGSLAERAFSRFHETRITGLVPGTTYRFTIEGDNHVGMHGVLTVGTFTTLPAVDISPPSNVTDLKAVKEGDDIVLTWKNPEDPDFDRVRVMRNENFYPHDTADGWFVYEDDGEVARDSGVAIPDTIQFYTVFTYDTNGNISSGAIVAIRIGEEGAVPVHPGESEENPIEFKFPDIEFIQDGKLLPSKENSVIVDGSKHLIIAVPHDRVPEHLKTILITLSDRMDASKTFSFLLRINEEKTAYTAIIAPLGVSGTFPFRISIFDYKTSQVGYATGDVISQITHLGEEDTGFLGYLKSSFTVFYKGYLLLFVLFLICLLLVSRRLLSQKKVHTN